MPTVLDRRGGRYFDLVVFSGVLYHLINPLGLLATARGFCKVGGLIVVETVAFQHPEEKLVFNAGGRLYGSVDNYFIPTTSWLDYSLRMLGLRPLGIAYFGSVQDPTRVRVAVLCRSEALPCPLRPDDDWPSYSRHEDLFGVAGQIDWPTLRRTSSRIECTPPDRETACEARSILDAVESGTPHRFTTEETRLSLSSTM